MKEVLNDLNDLMDRALKDWRKGVIAVDKEKGNLYGNLAREVAKKRKKLKAGKMASIEIEDVKDSIDAIEKSLSNNSLTQDQVDDLMKSNGSRCRDRRIAAIFDD
jgi:hypothetical protein